MFPKSKGPQIMSFFTSVKVSDIIFLAGILVFYFQLWNLYELILKFSVYLIDILGFQYIYLYISLHGWCIWIHNSSLNNHLFSTCNCKENIFLIAQDLFIVFENCLLVIVCCLLPIFCKSFSYDFCLLKILF